MRPKKFDMPFRCPASVCAFGSQSKNTLAFAQGKTIVLSPVHNDLAVAADCRAFERTARAYVRKKPRRLAYDMHPGYYSSSYARALSGAAYEHCPVQHHHAHVASCMAERGLGRRARVIGVAFDGTGFGPGGTVWGAEFLICGYAGYERAGHLREVPLIGGEAAVRQPWRTAAFMLEEIFGPAFAGIKLDFCSQPDVRDWPALRQIAAAGVNAPYASSMGRLFDAVASIVLARTRAAHEAELAIALQKAAEGCRVNRRPYPFSLRMKDGRRVIDPLPMVEAIVSDLRAGRPREELAFAFHRTVAEMVLRTCRLLRDESGIKTVVLAGGVFQNTLLLGLTADILYKEGFIVLTHTRLPPSDAALSLGQAVIAAGKDS